MTTAAAIKTTLKKNYFQLTKKRGGYQHILLRSRFWLFPSGDSLAEVLWTQDRDANFYCTEWGL